MTFMRLCRRPLFIVLVSLISVALHADSKQQLDGNLLLTAMDAGSTDNFKSGRAITLHYNYYFNNWLAADAGLLLSGKTLEESSEDIVGAYRTNIQTQALLLGVKPRYRLESPYEFYGRLGLQYWRTELEVEEYFGEGIPKVRARLLTPATVITWAWVLPIMLPSNSSYCLKSVVLCSSMCSKVIRLIRLISRSMHLAWVWVTVSRYGICSVLGAVE
jgi:hypothetical protein